MSVVAVDDLALRFGDRTLFEGLDFELERGELLAVLGPNGTGKTSLIRILLGLLQPSAGSVVIEGCPPQERCHRIGYVPQQRVFDRDVVLRGRDLVRLGLDGHRWGFGRFSSEDRARVDASLAEVGAAAYADAPDRPALGRRAAAATRGAGARRRPRVDPRRRAAALPRPRPPARRRRPARRAPASAPARRSSSSPTT